MSKNSEWIRMQHNKKEQEEKGEMPTTGRREKIDGEAQARDTSNDEG